MCLYPQLPYCEVRDYCAHDVLLLDYEYYTVSNRPTYGTTFFSWGELWFVYSLDFYKLMWDAKHSLRLKLAKSSPAISRVSWVKITDVSGTVSLPIIRVWTFISVIASCALHTTLNVSVHSSLTLRNSYDTPCITCHVPNTKILKFSRTARPDSVFLSVSAPIRNRLTWSPWTEQNFLSIVANRLW